MFLMIFGQLYPSSVPAIFFPKLNPRKKNELHSNLTKWFIDSNKKNKNSEIIRAAVALSNYCFEIQSKT